MIAEDAADAALARELQTDPAVARHLVFCGDPHALSPDVAARCAVVSLAPAAASGLSVLVDRQAATVHPLGRVLRPHLQSAQTARALEELVADTGDERLAPTRSSTTAAGSSAPGAATPRASCGVGSGAPGRVDVRLLTPSPRLDGLAEELPTNRARRAVELVAYLALHQPDVVNSDRLRTRVLGSADADAAAKTLFNTAHAARRAMGADAHGELLFPAAGRDGLYRLSPEVTVDVERAAALAGEGSRHAGTQPDMALACLRAALDLVEGEPLANALTGYSWWEAEGHGGRTAAVLVEAACTMATLAAERGHFELARWGLAQARLVAPYSEALSRAAMRTAGAEGDAERLRAEWRECQRLIDALDPGSTPSQRTESLFGELNRALAGKPARPYAPVMD